MNERFRVTSNPKYLSVVFDERKKRHYVGTDCRRSPCRRSSKGSGLREWRRALRELT